MFVKYVNAMKYLEIIPDFLSMYGVFTSQNTSQIRQEMSTMMVYGSSVGVGWGLGCGYCSGFFDRNVIEISFAVLHHRCKQK